MFVGHFIKMKNYEFEEVDVLLDIIVELKARVRFLEKALDTKPGQNISFQTKIKREQKETVEED